MNEPTTEALDMLAHLLGRDVAANVLQRLADAGLRVCWADDRTANLLVGGGDVRCATCVSLLGRELVLVDAGDAVHCRACEARRLAEMLRDAERIVAVLL